MPLTVYASLFFVSFAAATIIPMQSEAVLSALLLSGDYDAGLLVLVASAGNTLGAVVNWGLGLGIERFHDRKWFPVKPEALAKAKGWYLRYGRWSLLLSWLPFIGDALTVAAGIMKEKLHVFLALVAVAKTARYVVIALAIAWR